MSDEGFVEDYNGFRISRSAAGYWVEDWDYEGENYTGPFSSLRAAEHHIDLMCK